jgi:glycosyltransferase involved in cell wall biosynthesis
MCSSICLAAGERNGGEVDSTNGGASRAHRSALRVLYVGQPGFLRRTTGAGLRCRVFLDALREVGVVDVFEPPPDMRLMRMARRVRHRVRPEVNGTHVSRHARSAFRTRLREPFDLVWFSNLHSFASLGADVRGRVAIDVARVESMNLARELKWRGADTPGAKQMERGRRLWLRLEERCVARADFISVCNDIDRAALTPSDSAVIPTGYAEPRCRRQGVDLHDPPVLVLQGTLYLKQNADAARHLTSNILPQIRNSRPDVQLRIVGPGPANLVKELNGHDGVTATGYVEDITSELVNADIALAPIWHGGGIHVKVIEAFAHQLPVVTTAIGTEGIDPQPEREALVARDSGEFADRCVELLENLDLRRRIAIGGRQLFCRRFELRRVQEQIAGIARRVARGERVAS